MTPEIPSTVYKSKPAHERVSFAVGILWSVLFFLEYTLGEKCFLWNVNSRTPPYGHLVITATFFGPAKRPYIFLW